MEMAAEAGLVVDRDEFDREMAQQRARAKADNAAKKRTHGDLGVYREFIDEHPTEFTGYDKLVDEATVVGLVADGARVIIVPSFWLADEGPSPDMDHGGGDGAQTIATKAATERLFVGSACVTRAFENTAAIVYVNAGAPAGLAEGAVDGQGYEYLGLSQVAMPLQGALGKMGPPEGVNVVDIDFSVLDKAEEAYKVREDIAREGWHYVRTLSVGGKQDA